MANQWVNEVNKNRLLFQKIWQFRKAEIRGVAWVGREILLKTGNHLFKLPNFMQVAYHPENMSNACLVWLTEMLQNLSEIIHANSL